MYIGDTTMPTLNSYVKKDDEQALADIQFILENNQMKLVMHCVTVKEA